MAAACNKPFIILVLYKKIMNVFIRAMVRKMECSIQLGFASLNKTFHLSPHENILTIALLIYIHYLYTIPFLVLMNTDPLNFTEHELVHWILPTPRCVAVYSRGDIIF